MEGPLVPRGAGCRSPRSPGSSRRASSSAPPVHTVIAPVAEPAASASAPAAAEAAHRRVHPGSVLNCTGTRCNIEPTGNRCNIEPAVAAQKSPKHASTIMTESKAKLEEWHKQKKEAKEQEEARIRELREAEAQVQLREREKWERHRRRQHKKLDDWAKSKSPSKDEREGWHPLRGRAGGPQAVIRSVSAGRGPRTVTPIVQNGMARTA